MDDWSLLQKYVGLGSKESLDELVRRHLPMVYAAALRQVHDPHLAEDVTQAVFLVLMKRANQISRGVVLGGWLYNVTRFAAAKTERDMWRRQKHEQKAAAMKPLTAKSDSGECSGEIARLLDDAIAGLSRVDREAVVLKYLQGRSNAEVAQAQGVNENAARQRIFRALRKLRAKLNRKGTSVSDEMLGAALVILSSHAPPAEIANRIVHVLHDSTSAGASTAVVSMLLAESVLRIIVMAKIKSSALVGIVLVVLLAAGGLIIHSADGDTAGTQTAQGAADTPNRAFLDVLNAFNKGDGDAMVSDFAHLTPEQETTIRHIAAAIAVGNDIRAAVAEKFGQTAGQNVLRQLGFIPPIATSSIEKTKATIDGDNAQLNIPRLGVIYFDRIDGHWKLTSDALFDNKEAVDRFGTITANAAQFQKLIDNVKADKYSNEQEVETNFKQLMTRLQDKDPAGDLPDRPAVLGPATRPTDTIASFYWANLAGDKAAALNCFQNPSPEQQIQINTVLELFTAGEQLRLAIADQFSKQVARTSILVLGLDPGLTKQNLDSLKQEPTGDRVHIDLSKIGMEFDLVNANGVWKIDPSFLGPDNPLRRAWMHEHYLSQLLQLTADVKGGTYQTPAQLMAAVDEIHQNLVAENKQLPPATRPY